MVHGVNLYLYIMSIVVGVTGMKVEAVTEEKASRCLQRITLLSTIREEVSTTCTDTLRSNIPHFIPTSYILAPDPSSP